MLVSSTILIYQYPVKEKYKKEMHRHNIKEVMINPPEKDVVDLFPNESPQAEEFAVYSVQNGLEKISLPWVLTIKQF